jgi:hypothetical protein
MKNIKWLLATIFIALIVYSNTAKADEKTYSPSETIEAFSEVPGKVANHISNEWSETKEYQAKSWAEMKAQWQALITKLSIN